jgi:hypothetical protein
MSSESATHFKVIFREKLWRVDRVLSDRLVATTLAVSRGHKRRIIKLVRVGRTVALLLTLWLLIVPESSKE